MKPIPTWRESLDTPENTISPNHIHASVEEVQGAMQAEIDALRQRNAELEADKARLDWLEREAVITYGYDRTVKVAFQLDELGRTVVTLRHTVDEAMKDKPDVEGHPV